MVKLDVLKFCIVPLILGLFLVGLDFWRIWTPDVFYNIFYEKYCNIKAPIPPAVHESDH